ncbi:MAG: sigma 54-interacting transcriptional regulator [Granulosicoccus sp.]
MSNSYPVPPSQLPGDVAIQRLFSSAAAFGKALIQGFALSDEPTYLLDPYSGQVLRANTAAERLFRLPGHTLAGQYIDKLYPQHRAQLYVFTEEAIALGQARTRSLSLLRPDGSAISIEHVAIAFSQGDSTVVLVRLVDLDALHRRDVNEAAESYLRKGLHAWLKDEQYFREIEREYRLILAAAGEGIYGVSAEGCTTFLNPAAEAMLGYRADELVGRDMHEAIHHHRVDGSLYPSNECPIYNAFKAGTVNTVNNEVFWRKDGTSIPVEYTSTPIVDSGNLIGAVIVFRDMTERHNNEETLRLALIENAALRERLEMENAYLQEEIRSRGEHHNIIGNSESLNALLAQIDLVGPTDANVLISGESGTGKELIAHAIHRASVRAERPLIRVNCAAIPRELFESEFFGHVKGAFSGAVRDRIGRFELADGGTLFLDEVGELEMTLQAKLLRVVQEGKFERVGEEKSRVVDVRLIAATNRDLKMAVEAGDFREDLFFRLNVFPIECTPLRQRASDIPQLAEHYLTSTCQRLNLLTPRLTRATMRSLMEYSWPGNIRELQNVIERAAILSRNGKLTIDLPSAKTTLPSTAESETSSQATMPEKILTAAELADIERQNLTRALAACGGKVSGKDGAARLLGMKPTTVYSRIKSWQLE